MKNVKIIAALILVLFLNSCSVYNSLMNLSKLKFKLDSVNNFKVSNMLITNKSKLSDFNTVDILKLTSEVVSGNFPVSFTVNVLTQNPNTSSSKSTFNDITLDSFPWTLYIDDKETISGNISAPVEVPAVENATVIPLEMSLDLMNFFKGEGLNDLVNLALSLGGQKSNTSRVKIVASPVLGTPLGKMSYPSPLTIIDKSFN